MTYTKPEVTLLGEASLVIQSSKPNGNVDGFPISDDTAYELDEE